MSRYLDILRKISTSQQLQACLMMTIGLCFHFLGYECSRAASITLLAANVKFLYIIEKIFIII